MMSQHNAKLLVDARNSLGESPRWSHRTDRICWLDIDAGTVWSTTSSGGQTTTDTIVAPLGTLEFTASGDRVVTIGAELAHWGPGGELRTIARTNARGVRFNDSGVDAAGRLWTSTMPVTTDAQECELFRLTDAGALVPTGIPVGAGNGITWNKAGTVMYFSDSSAGTVNRADYALGTGIATNVGVFVSFEMGIPDGLLIDSDDGLWVALWGSGELRRFSPDGTLTDCVRVPTPYVTAAAFGGEGYTDMFITTARRENTDENAGGLFHIRSHFRGIPRPPVSWGVVFDE